MNTIPTITHPDLALLRAVAARDKEALRQLYERHGAKLFALALTILGDRTDAEDVLQETFVQIWTIAGSFDEHRAKPLGWLIMLTRSRAIDRLRAQAMRVRLTSVVESPGLDEAPPPQDQATAGETRETVRRALESLPTEQRQPIELAYFAGLTQSGIADRLGQPPGMIKTRIRMGLLRLRATLGDGGERKESLAS